MKKILFYLSLLSTPIFCQTPTLQWERSINGNSSSDDYPVKSVKDAQGNIYVTGYQVGSEVFLVKYDNNGNQLYRTTYFGPGLASSRPSDIAVDDNGNVYISGSSYAVVTGLTSNMLIKFNASGAKVWEYFMTPNYPTFYGNAFQSIAFDKATNPTYLFATGSHNDSIVVNKIAIGSGTSVWMKKLEMGTTLTVKTDNSGNPFVCGLTRRNFSTNGEDGFVAKLNTNGNVAWTQSFNGAADTADVANHLEILTNGAVIVSGNVRDSAGTGFAWLKVMNIGVSGAVVWDHNFHTSGYTLNEEADMTLNAAQTEIFVASNSKENFGAHRIVSRLQRIDINGNLILTNSYAYGVSSATKAADLATDIYGNVYVLGTTYNNSGYLIGYLWKNSPAISTLASSTYSTLNTNAIVYMPSGLEIDNAGNPFATFLTYNYNNSANKSDVVLVKFNSSCGVTWEVFYNGRDYSTNHITGMTMDASGGVYIGGSIDNQYTQSDAVIAKYNADGTQQWLNTFDDGGAGTNYGGGLVSDAQSNLYFLSQSYGSSYLLKYDSSGNQLWNTWVPLKASELMLDSNGAAHLAAGANPLLYNVINSRSFATAVVGTTGALGATGVLSHDTGYFSYPASITLDNNQNAFILGTVENTSYSNANVLLQKFNSAAQSTWYYLLPGMDSTVFEQARAAKVIFNKNDNFIYAICSATPAGSTASNEIILKVDPTSNAVTTYSMAGTSSYAVYDAILSPSNEIYTTGRMYAGFTGYYFYVHKYDVNGNVLWEKLFRDNAYGNNPYSAGQGLTIDANGNVLATGFVSGTQSGTLNLYTVKISSAGVTLWSRTYDGPINGDDKGKFVRVTSAGRVYVGGEVESGPYEGVQQDIALLKYCDFAQPTLSSSGSASICSNHTYTVSAPAASSYMWSNGATTQTIGINITGNYFCVVTESDGCFKNTDTLHVNVVGAPARPDICMVTVDDSSKHNLVIWNKTPYLNTGVIGFNIYREDLTNIYHLVGSVPIANLSQFIDLDPTANPNANTKRYKLTAVDSCGNESQMSNFHNTIYIVSNGSGQFSWNLLYTIENSPNPVAQYILLRDDYNTNSWHAVDSTAGTQFNINDANFAAFQPTANWRVVTQWNIQCTPTERAGNGNSVQTTIVKSKSNISNNRVASVGDLSERNVIAYPNPTSNDLHVSFPASSRTLITLTDLLGNSVRSLTSLTNNEVIDMSDLAAGTYLLQVTNDAGKFIKRIVKE